MAVVIAPAASRVTSNWTCTAPWPTDSALDTGGTSFEGTRTAEKTSGAADGSIKMWITDKGEVRYPFDTAHGAEGSHTGAVTALPWEA